MRCHFLCVEKIYLVESLCSLKFFRLTRYWDTSLHLQMRDLKWFSYLPINV